MARQHAIIYVPGLGDRRVRGQRLAVNAWKLQAIEPHLVQMHWMDGEDFAPKLKRLLDYIDKLVAAGKRVSLVAASAGASAALNAYAVRQESIHGMVSICGKLQGADGVHPSTYSSNPAFHQSMLQLPASYQVLASPTRRRILSMHPLADESVPIADTKLEGTTPYGMPVAGHFWGITYGLTVGSRAAIGFLKQLPDQSVVDQ